MGLRMVVGFLLICIFWVREGEGKLCKPNFKGKTLNFESCAELGSGFSVYWSLQNNSVDTLFEAESDGWAGLGWGSSSMTPADAVVVYELLNGSVEAKDYTLESRSSNGVTVDNRQSLGTSIEAERSGKLLKARFLRPLKPTGKAKTLDGSLGAKTSLIYAVGPKAPKAPELTTHSGRGARTVVLSSKGAQTSSIGISTSTWIIVVHGSLMFASWGLLIPVNIILMRFMKKYKKPIFLIHSIGNAIAVVMILVGVILAFIAGSHTRIGHLIVGIVVLVASIVQLLLGLKRPAKDAPRRVGWQTLHSWLGRGALLLGWLNIIFGLIVFQARRLSIILCVVVFVANIAVTAIFSCMPNRFPVTETGPTGTGVYGPTGEHDLNWNPNEIDETNDAVIPPAIS